MLSLPINYEILFKSNFKIFLQIINNNIILIEVWKKSIYIKRKQLHTHGLAFFESLPTIPFKQFTERIKNVSLKIIS